MIEYIFKMEDETEYRFEVDLDRHQKSLPETRPPAFWTVLGFKQCPNCPLNSAEYRYCPVAVDVEQIAARFRHMLSYTKTTVEVRTPERTYMKQCDAQTGLCALLGLVMATSACPILSQLKGLAYYHLPFSTLEETLFRTTSAYLLKQYFVFKAGREPDLDLKGLSQLYEALQQVNAAFKLRLESASESDANLNAVTELACVAMMVSFSLEDKLRELRPRFISVIG